MYSIKKAKTTGGKEINQEKEVEKNSKTLKNCVNFVKLCNKKEENKISKKLFFLQRLRSGIRYRAHKFWIIPALKNTKPDFKTKKKKIQENSVWCFGD